MEDTSGGNTAAVAPEDSTPAQQQRRHSVLRGLEHQSPPPPVRTAVKHYIKGTLWIVPTALLSYLLGWGNFAARDAILKATIGNATLVEEHDGGADVLVGVVGFRVWWEVVNCLIKTPKVGVVYLRRKPAMVLIEGLLWAAFILGIHPYGLNSLWVFFTGYCCSVFIGKWRFDGRQWKDSIRSATLVVSVISMYITTIAIYIAVATNENLDLVVEVFITGVVYPALLVGLKALMLSVVAKEESKILGQRDNAFYEDAARLAEISLALPCVVSILRIASTLAFVASATLSFGCEIGGIFFTMLRHTPRVYKEGSRKMETLQQQTSLRGGKIGSFKKKSSNALMGELEQKKRRFAIRIANEEWAERLVVATAAPIVFILSSNNITAQTLALRTLGLFAAEAGVDAIKTAICHRFGVMVGLVEVRLDVWSIGMCVAQYIGVSFVLSVGIVLYNYV